MQIYQIDHNFRPGFQNDYFSHGKEGAGDV